MGHLLQLPEGAAILLPEPYGVHDHENLPDWPIQNTIECDQRDSIGRCSPSERLHSLSRRQVFPNHRWRTLLCVSAWQVFGLRQAQVYDVPSRPVQLCRFTSVHNRRLLPGGQVSSTKAWKALAMYRLRTRQIRLAGIESSTTPVGESIAHLLSFEAADDRVVVRAQWLSHCFPCRRGEFQATSGAISCRKCERTLDDRVRRKSLCSCYVL